MHITKKSFILKTLFIITFLLLLLIVFLWNFLFTATAQQFIQSKVNEIIPGKVCWKSLDISLLRGTVNLSDLNVFDSNSNSVAKFGSFSIDIVMRELLNKRVVVSSINLNNFSAKIDIDSSGAINIVNCFVSGIDTTKTEIDSTQSTTPLTSIIPKLDLIVKEVNIENCNLSLKMAKNEIDANVDSLTITISANLIEQIASTKLSINKITYADKKAKLSLHNTNFLTAISKRDVDSLYFATNLNNSTPVELKGRASNVLNIDSMITNITCRIESELSQLRDISRDIPNISGKFKTTLLLHGVIDNPEASININISNPSFEDVSLDSFSTSIAVENRLVTISKLHAQKNRSVVNLFGSINAKKAFENGFTKEPVNLDELTSNITLQLQDIYLKEFIKNGDINGNVNGNLVVVSRGVDPNKMNLKVLGTIESSDLALKNSSQKTSLKVGLNSTLSNNRLNIANASLTINKEINLNVNGKYNLKSKYLESELSLSAKSIEKTLSSFGVRNSDASISLQAKTEGRADRYPATSIALQCDSIHYSAITVDNFDVNVDLDKSGKIDLSKLFIQSKNSTFNVSALYDLANLKKADFKDSQFKCTIDNTSLNIEDFLSQASLLQASAMQTTTIIDSITIDSSAADSAKIKPTTNDAMNQLLAQNLKGNIAIQADFIGSINHPLGNLLLTVSDLKNNYQAIENFSINAKADNDTITLNNLNIRINDLNNIDLSGWYNTNSDFSMQLLSKAITLSDIEMLDSMNLLGTLDINILAKGNIKKPVVNSTINLQSSSFNGDSLPNIHTEISLQDNNISLQGNLGFDILGNYNVLSKDFDAKILFNKYKLDRYLKLANLNSFFGEINGVAKVKGNSDQLDNLSGNLNLDELNLQSGDKTIINSNFFEISYINNIVTFNRCDIAILDKGNFDINGLVNIKDGINLQLSGNIPVEVATYFQPDLTGIKGDLTFDVAANGTFEKPNINSNIYLVNASFPLTETQQKLKNINGDFNIKDNIFTINSFNGELDNGRFAADGYLKIIDKDIDIWDFNFKATSLPFVLPEKMISTFNTNINANGNLKKSRISGDITLLEGTWYEDIKFSMDMLKSINTSKKAKVAESKIKEKSPLDNIDLDIFVKRRNPFLIYNNMADLKLIPDIQIKGTPSNPILDGRAQIADNGVIKFLSREFRIKKGIIDFNNSNKIDPMLNIEADIFIKKWKITLKIDEYSSDPHFQLSSQPYEEDSDILAIILTGDKFSGSSSSGSAINQEELIKKMILGLTSSKLQKTIGADVVEMKMGDDSTDKNSLSITIGEQLSRRLMTYYTVETKSNKVTQKGEAEYKILDNVNLNGYQTSDGEYGVELEYEKEFR